MYSPVRRKSKTRKSLSARKSKRKNKSKTKKKSSSIKDTTKYTISTPTSLSAFPDKSPQLQHPEKTRLNLFTTQNIHYLKSLKRQKTILHHFYQQDLVQLKRKI